MASNVDINLNARTKDFEDAFARSKVVFEKFASSGQDAAKSYQKSLKEINNDGQKTVDSLQKAFNSLSIKTDMNMEAQKRGLTAAKLYFEQQFHNIKDSGKASAAEIERAYTAMTAKIAALDAGMPGGTAKTTEGIKGMTQGMSGFSLASVAAIAKIQILYSLINQTMSAIGSLPGLAIDAIENFNSSVIKNSAVITSQTMTSTKDLGAEYQKNKVYAESVQKELVKMDAETVASYEQLQLMNDAFVQQGVYIDMNNKKQREGYKGLADAIATISAGMSNPNMQFSQEIRALMNGEDKATNQLFRMLSGIDPLLKEHIASWKKIAYETGNAGYVLEKLQPLLVGFAAAQGDINNLWLTVKSTMATIRDDILRGGLKDGFGEIVEAMKEMAKYANENKEKIQAWLQEGFKDAKKVVTFLWDMRSGIKLLGEVALYAGVVGGITSVITALTKLIKTWGTAEAIAKGGFLVKLISNPLALPVAAGVGVAMFGKGLYDESQLNKRAESIKSTMSSRAVRPDDKLALKDLELDLFKGAQLEAILKEKPLITNEEIIQYIAKKAIQFDKVQQEIAPGEWGEITNVVWDESKIKQIQDAAKVSVTTPKTPKTGKGGKLEKVVGDNKENAFLGMWNSLTDKTVLDTYESNLAKIETQIMNLKTAYDSMNKSEQKSFLANSKKAGIEGSPLKWLEDSLKTKLKSEEELKGNSLIGILAKAEDKGEKTQLQRQLESVKTESDSALTTFSKLSSVAKDFLAGKGIDETRIKKAFEDLGTRIKEDFNQKVVQNFEKIKESVYESTGQYEKAVESKIAFEKSKKEYLNDLTDEQKKLKEIEFSLMRITAKEKERQNVRTKELNAADKKAGAIKGTGFDIEYYGYAKENAKEKTDVEDKYAREIELAKNNAEELVKINNRKNAELAMADQVLSTQRAGIALDFAQQSISLAKTAFAGNKEAMIAALVLEKTIAVARIMISTEIAAAGLKAAYAAIPGGLALAAAQEAVMRSMSYISIGLVLASGAIEGMQIAGARASGGPVKSGATYLVGEKGPELWTAPADGAIIPNNQLNGNGVTVNQSINITGVGADIMTNVKIAAKQAADNAKAQILNSMNRGGEFAMASGRIK